MHDFSIVIYFHVFDALVVFVVVVVVVVVVFVMFLLSTSALSPISNSFISIPERIQSH